MHFKNQSDDRILKRKLENVDGDAEIGADKRGLKTDQNTSDINPTIQQQ